MNPETFLMILAVGFAAIFSWAFHALPRERWQIIAAVPQHKTAAGEWQGLNLTYYGFFQATSNTLAVAVMFVLLGAIGVSAKAVAALILITFALCWPASRLIARTVEKKAYTFTVGGAVFVGVIFLPWLVALLNATASDVLGKLPTIPVLAAAAVAYAYGEGLGRLGCISFGCCYGKSFDQLSPRFRRLLGPFSFTFTGATKKAVYEGQLGGVRLAPIQAVTAVIFIIIALAGAYLFLKSFFVIAMLATITATQVWRFLSELLRADVRGGYQKVSAYQVMALLMVIYSVIIAFIFSDSLLTKPVIAAGVSSVWDPGVLLFCQAIWLAIFLITGRSMVTGSTLSFFVHRDRI